MDVILHAKVEYTKQLQKIMKKGIYTTFSGIFEESKSNKKQVLKTFQSNLVKIPNWNQDTIHLKHQEVVNNISEELFEKLIQAIVISNVKIFGAIKKNSNARVEVTLPDPKSFVHKVYIQCARSFYSRPNLFENRSKFISHNVMAKNNIKITNVISESIEETIRSILPFSSILEEYFRDEPEALNGEELQGEISNLLGDESEDDEETKEVNFEDDEDNVPDEEAKEVNSEDDEDDTPEDKETEGDIKNVNLDDEVSDTEDVLSEINDDIKNVDLGDESDDDGDFFKN